ncbi:MAG: beta-N-acetylhexosaminidase, partial [Eudoraea sp.]|nr:beta-N-acetylhexosaminidase [Eudoraea sp.]
MKSTFFLKAIAVLVILIVFTSCQERKIPVYDLGETDLVQENLIPYPLSVKAGQGGFALDQYTGIFTTAQDEAFEEVGVYLA